MRFLSYIIKFEKIDTVRPLIVGINESEQTFRVFHKFHRLRPIIRIFCSFGIAASSLRCKKNNYAITKAMISLTLNTNRGFAISVKS
ncbi:MAG: hypothetical protein AUH71_00325 [Thaumarchaeota archaeon 13_1_40CM_4_48_7]|nr:MAG: hypothetical protein AUH71_00325 [Thaumarchaeota archaeon 13_1_40CM_4_48_7]